MRFVPRSAVFGQQLDPTDETPSRAAQARSMPTARGYPGRAGNPGTNAVSAMPESAKVALLKGQLIKVHNDRTRIVKEANAKLGALSNRVRQLEGMLRTAYSPNVQVPGQGQVDVGVPTHTLRNPNIYTVDGARGAPPAMPNYSPAGNPNDSAGNPGSDAQDAQETVRTAEDAIFYGSGDSAFYEGGEND